MLLVTSGLIGLCENLRHRHIDLITGSAGLWHMACLEKDILARSLNKPPCWQRYARGTSLARHSTSSVAICGTTARRWILPRCTTSGAVAPPTRQARKWQHSPYAHGFGNVHADLRVAMLLVWYHRFDDVFFGLQLKHSAFDWDCTSKLSDWSVSKSLNALSHTFLRSDQRCPPDFVEWTSRKCLHPLS